MRFPGGWLGGAALYAAALLPAVLSPIRRLHGHPRAYLREFYGYPASILLRDATLNVAMFVPLGWLLARAARSRGVNAATGVVMAVALAAGFSLCIETIQYFIATRYSSILDVLANATGAGAGAVLAGWRSTRA